MKLEHLHNAILIASLCLFLNACETTSIKESVNKMTNAVSDILETDEEPASQNLAASDATDNKTKSKMLNQGAANFSASEEIANCITKNDVEAAAAATLLLVGEEKLNNLVSDDIAPYLIGLCLPHTIDKRYTLNQYLITKGSMHSFYVESHMQSLAKHLEASGVELGIKYETLINSIEQDNHSQAISLSMIENLLPPEGNVTAESFAIAKHIDQLDKKQQKKAREIAALARAHAINANYFLIRGLYVSQKITEQLAQILSMSSAQLLEQTRSGQLVSLKAAKTYWNRFVNSVGLGEEENDNSIFLRFVKDNSQAVATSLTNTVTLVAAFDTRATEIPRLSEKTLRQDIRKQTKKWQLPAVFTGEDEFSEDNNLVTSEVE